MLPVCSEQPIVNVAARVSTLAQQMPDAVAVVEAMGRDRRGERQYRKITFRQLDEDSNRIAAALRRMGVMPAMRLALLVRPGIDFISLVLALFKAGVVIILIDPGMGKRNLVKCLSDAEPRGFIAIPPVQAVRSLLGRRFPAARFNVTVGRRWFWGGPTLDQLRREPAAGFEPSPTTREDPAAIIFTTGSTGPPKGVLYAHGNFDAQVEEIRDFFAIQPREIDVSCFPLFGLFNCAMGVTAVIPRMDPTRPAEVDPVNIVEAVRDWKATQAFGSPALWNRVGRYCRDHAIRLETLRRVLSSGAPVAANVLQAMKDSIHPEGDMHTPYGATESLPVASIAASEVLRETAARTREGGGVCVGRKFSRIDWKVIRVVDGPIRSLAEAEEMPPGEIGELIVHGPVVTRRYVTRIESNAAGKIPDGEDIWHRMGDVGYLDDRGRFWFCGRMAHRVRTVDGPMYTIPCESIFNQHPDIYRSALVGVGPAGRQRPIIVLQPHPGRMPTGDEARQKLLDSIRQLGQSHPLTAKIEDFLLHPSFPVDIRHNAKIFREKLAVWAAARVGADS
ncbi:MAG: AMP-binding protein [Rhodopirellula sp.]|nr:AMP-binding protein [Rhodopirellula sp.]